MGKLHTATSSRKESVAAAWTNHYERPFLCRLHLIDLIRIQLSWAAWTRLACENLVLRLDHVRRFARSTKILKEVSDPLQAYFLGCDAGPKLLQFTFQR